MIAIVNGLLTLALIILFIGIWAWAWSSQNKAPFEAMARLPLEDGDKSEGGNYAKQ